MIYPITFGIPEEKIVKDDELVSKTKLLSSLIPGDMRTYIYNTESEYYDEYKKSYFAITKKKGGWDCLRHYEILANGCVPYFVDLEKCPPNVMHALPKELLMYAKKMYDSGVFHDYDALRKKLLEYTKEHLTTEKVARSMLERSGHGNAKKVLYLSKYTAPDYLRCLTLHGLKKIFGTNCHDFPKIPHIYKTNSTKHLYGKGMTYSNLLEHDLHDDTCDANVIEDIKNKRYDVVIYGSYHRGLPYYDVVCQAYANNEIILMCGEDDHACDAASHSHKGHHVFVRECE